MDHPKHLPASPHPRTHRPTKRLLTMHQIRHSLGIQQRLNQKRRRMESSLYHQRRLIQTHHYVLQTHQLPRNIPNDDELNLLRRSSGTMDDYLHGRHGNTHQKEGKPNQTTTHSSSQILHMPSSCKTPKTQPLPQTGEMHI
jgi:hypothetical protein